MHMFVVHCTNGLHNILHGGHVECGLTWVIPAWDDPHHSQSWPIFVAKQYNLMVQCIFSPFLTKKSSQTGMSMCCHDLKSRDSFANWARLGQVGQLGPLGATGQSLPGLPGLSSCASWAWFARPAAAHTATTMAPPATPSPSG